MRKVVLFTLLLAGAAQAQTTLTVITHDSFEVDKKLVAQFEAANPARVRFVKGGDAGELLNRTEYLQSAKMSAERLLGTLREDGSVPGRLNHHWQGTVAWSCLTGNAQLAGIWLRLFLK